MSLDQRDVNLVDAATLELTLKVVVCGLVLGDDDKARRVLVQPMHDAGAIFFAYTAQFRRMREHRVDERAGSVARRRMHYHAGRFVDDDKVGVFVDDVEWDGFSPRLGGQWRRDAHDDGIAWPDFVRGLAWLAVDRDRAFVNEPLNCAACQVQALLRQQSGQVEWRYYRQSE